MVPYRNGATMRVPLAIIVAAALALPADAHMKERPDLDQWLMSLGSARSPCCDNKEAETLADPDWRVDRLGECKPSERASFDTDETFKPEFCVRLENPQNENKGDWNWWTVPGSAVVHEPNRAGPALIWLYWNSGQPYIRCFMPGAGT